MQVMSIAIEAEFEPALAREAPPPLDRPRPRPMYLNVTEQFIQEIRASYGPGIATDDGRILNDFPEVRRWIEGLRPGKVRPRK